MRLDSETIEHAAALWSYLASFKSIGPADAVVVCCSYDLRVCDHACSLMREGWAKRFVISGDTGHWTRHLWKHSEAVVFRERALANGLDPLAIMVEDKATNFGENISFSRKLIPDAKSVVFVTKPAAVLRVLLTARAQWAGITVHVSCPNIGFPDEVSNVVGVLGVIDEMVGDVQRIQEYPKLGYQVAHELPKEVVDSWSYLFARGFTRHLIVPSRKGFEEPQ